MKRIRNLSYYLLALLMTNKVFAQTCDPSDQACLTAPEGILSGNAKAGQAMTFFNWVLFSVSMAGAIIFGMKAAKKLSDEQWVSSLGPMFGSLLCGITTYVAYSVVN